MQTLKMDFQSQSAPPVVPVMQSDSQSRFIGITLYDGGVAYKAPSGAVYTVEYHGPGANNTGWYDTIQLSSGTRKAVTVDSSNPNIVTLELAEQALRVNGEVEVSLCVVNNTGYKLNTFPIICRVTGAPYVDPTSVRSYFYVTGLTSAQWLAYVTACQDAQKRAEDAAATFKTDTTLSISGKAADAKEVGLRCFPIQTSTDSTPDLNTYTTPGTYMFADWQTVTNGPDGTVNGMLYVYPVVTNGGLSQNQVIQYFFPIISKYGNPVNYGIYTRLVDNTRKTDWTRVDGVNVIPTTDSTPDLNTYTTPGTYMLTSSSTVTNAPGGMNNGILYVYPVIHNDIASEERIQYFFPIIGTSKNPVHNCIYWRYFSGLNWEEWVSATGNATLSNCLTPKTIDLNTYTTPGTYMLTSSSTVTNAPGGMNNGILYVYPVIHNDIASEERIQYFFPIIGTSKNPVHNCIYWRYFSGLNWAEWVSATGDATSGDTSSNPLNKKKWVVLGDSRSDPNAAYTSSHYYNIIANSNDMSVTSYAVSGYRSSRLMEEINKISTTPDIISIYIGVNDWGQSNPQPVGTFDGSETNTTYFYLKQAIETLQTKYPSATLFIMTFQPQYGFSSSFCNWDAKNSLGLSYEDYNEAIRYCAKYYSIPLYDEDYCGGDSVKNEATRKLYFADGLHQNLAGSKRLASGLEPFMKSIVNRF